MKKLAKQRQNIDSYLRDQVYDSCALQGENGLAANLGSFILGCSTLEEAKRNTSSG